MLCEFLTQPAAVFPDRPAIVQESGTVTYAEMLRATDAMGRRLREAGLGGGDTVGLQMPNSAEYVVALLAAWRVGAAVLPLDPALKEAEVESYRRLAGARAVLRPGDGNARPVAILPGSPGSAPRQPGGEDGTALLLLSSGTTGLPKLAVRTPRRTEAAIGVLKSALPCSSEDRVLGVLPFHHAAGLFNVLLSTLERGASLYVGPFSPRQAAATIERERITVLIAPPLVYRLLGQTDFSERPDLSSLRLAYTGTSAVSLGVVRGFEGRFGIAMTQGYGTTETHAVAVTRPGQRIDHPGMVGKPYPEVAVTIRDDAGAPVAPGAQGTVWVRSPAAATAYFHDAQASAATFSQSYVITGDLGRLDEAGNLVILGRKRPLLNVAGKKVAPAEVEACLRGHPAVAEVVVVGEPGPDGYDRIQAKVVRAGEVAAQDLRDFCASRLADFKVPRRFEFVRSLWRGAMGKPSLDVPAAEGGRAP